VTNELSNNISRCHEIYWLESVVRGHYTVYYRKQVINAHQHLGPTEASFAGLQLWPWKCMRRVKYVTKLKNLKLIQQN